MQINTSTTNIFEQEDRIAKAKVRMVDDQDIGLSARKGVALCKYLSIFMPHNISGCVWIRPIDSRFKSSGTVFESMYWN